VSTANIKISTELLVQILQLGEGTEVIGFTSGSGGMLGNFRDFTLTITGSEVPKPPDGQPLCPVYVEDENAKPRVRRVSWGLPCE